MALRASAKRMMATGGSMGQSEVLSAPAGAPVFSASLAEAKARARQFYRELCREVPWVMRTYWLEEVTTPAKFRAQLANEFRRHTTDDPRVIDVMLFKANQEMVTVAAHHFQRHHLITKYVAPESNVIDKARARGEKPKSAFLSAFLGGKATEPNGGIPKDF